MATENTVQIVIQATDTSGPVIQNVEAKLGAMAGTAGATAPKLQLVKGGLAEVGAAGASAAASMDQVGERMGAMHGNMRLVSGTAREFGLNLGYSMRSFLAESPAAITAIRAMEGGFIAIAAIDIGAQVIEGIHHLYEKWLDVTKAVEEYQQKAGEAAEQKLFDTASLEQTRDVLKDISDQVTVLEQKRNNYATYDITGFENLNGPSGESVFTAADDQAQAKAMENRDKLTEHQRQVQQQLDMERLHGQAAYDAAITQGYAHISAHEKDTIAEINQRYDHMKEEEQNLVKIHNDGIAAMKAAGKDVSHETVETADPHAFAQQRTAAIVAAQQEASGQRIALARTEQERVISLQNEAINAGARGEALHDEERQQAIDAVMRKFQHGEISKQTAAAETEALDMKFHNQKMVRLEEEEYATRKLQEQASQAGVTGIPKIQAETQSRINELTENPANAGLPDEEVKKRTAAYQQIGNQQIVEAQQQFSDKIAQITERSNDQMTSGLARVAAAERTQLTELARDYTEFYGADQAKWQGYQDAKTAIEQGAERERQKLAEDVDRSIAQTEAEAARALLPPWQAAQQKIADEYQQRLAKIREDVEQHVITEEQGAREVKAAWDQTNSEMERAAMESRDRMAGQLASFFDNPAKYMQQRAKQVMFDIMANWMQQAEQANPRLQGIFGGIFGQNQVGTGSPQHAIGQLFGMHGAAGAGGNSALTSAGSTLTSAGATLSSSGTMLASSAMALSQAATMWESALYSGGGGTSAGGGGGSDFSGWTGEGGGSSGGGGIFGGGGPSSTSFGGAGGGGGTAALSETLGIPPQLAAAIPGGSAIGSTLGLLQGFSNLFSSSGSSSGGGAQLLNASGGFQPSDINQAPTNSAGVLGTVPGSDSGGDSSGGGSGALGAIGGFATGGVTAFSGIESAWNSSNVGSGLIGAGTAALGGAEIGTMIMPGIGTAIGAAAGFAAGLTADLIGDHGASKARHYNTLTVVPTLQQLMNGYGTGGDYDSASMGINNLQIQSQKQTAQWGSGATSFYHSVMVPEFSNAQQQVDREGRAGRANVTTTAAQFHGGGWIDDFLDMATSNSEGFIHARQGEYMMHNAAASTNAPWLEAMNRGLDMTAALAPVLSPGAAPRETGAASDYMSASAARSSTAGGPGGSGAPVHLHVHAWDSKDVNRWLRGGGAMQIQTELNRNPARYSGKALSS